MSGSMWFGNDTHQQWVPCPVQGMMKNRERYSVSMKFENGGGDVVSTSAYQTTFDLGFPSGPANEYEGIEAFARYVSGEYGTGYVRFTDPIYASGNYFSTRYAAPGLIELGWPNWGASTPSYSNTTANVYNYPSRKATWTLTSAANAQSGDAYTFLVPPTYYFHIGATGSATGTAQIVFQPVGGAVTSITPVGDTTMPTYTDTYAGGSTGAVVKVFMRRTSTASSTLTLTALRAAITDSSTPPAPGRHMPGEGHEGLAFAGEDPIPVEYRYGPTKLVAMGGTRLEEVEPWR